MPCIAASWGLGWSEAGRAVPSLFLTALLKPESRPEFASLPSPHLEFPILSLPILEFHSPPLMGDGCAWVQGL